MNNSSTDGVRAVVFDMAGTTIDEGKTVYQCVRQAIADFGVDLPLVEVINRIGGMNKKEGIEKLLTEETGENQPEKVEEAFELFRQKVEEEYKKDDNIREMSGASDLFRFLQSNEIKVVLDTGYFRSTADILIDRMNWQNEGLIDFSVTSDEVPMGRPEPYMIQRVMERFELNDPASVVKVGDTRSDMEEGVNAGCTKIVGICSDQYSKEELLEMGATHVIDELKEIKEIVKK